MKILPLLTFFLIFVTSFAKAQSNESKPDINQYAVFTYNDERDGLLFKEDVKPATLTADEVKKIERVLRKQTPEFSRLMQENVKERANDEPADPALTKKAIGNCNKYFKQFVPVTNAKNQKEVWVNCFCLNNFPDWQTDIVTSDESNNCYFKFKINLATNIISQFWINGQPYEFEPPKPVINLNMPSRGRGF